MPSLATSLPPVPVIRRCDLQRLDLPLRTPFGIAAGVQAVARNVLMMVELDDGTCGRGEAAPLPPYNGETREQAMRVLAAAARWLPGRRVDDWRSLAAKFRARGGGACGSAQAAFEVALLDALTRRQGKPLWRWFGAAESVLETDLTITTGTPEAAANAAAAALGRGFRLLKVKIGGRGGPAHDLARLDGVVFAAPGARLILDGNAALSRAEAGELVRGLRARGVAPALLEQWLPRDDLAGLRALARESGWPVAADESVVTAADASGVAAAGAAQVINIKLMKAGVAVALEIVDVARRAGLGLMIGGNVESSLAMTAAASFAAGLGGFCHVDLDTPLFLAEDPFSGGMRYDGARISVDHITAGHGIA